jgi:SAM-dependent methyltransferase
VSATLTDAGPAACNLCGARDAAPRFTAEVSGRRVVRCRRCGLVFYDPMLSPAEAAALYSDDYFAREFPEESRQAARPRHERRLARIERETSRGRLLDVGCGAGGFLDAARARGWQVAGLDVAPAAARAAVPGVDVWEGDLSLARPAGVAPFDVVTMWDVLEHLTDPVGALREARRWVRPGGLLVVQTQDVDGVTSAWMGRRWEQYVEYHLYHFSSRTLHSALERGGFSEVRIEGSEAFVGLAAAPARNALDGLRRLRDHILVALGRDPFNIMVATARARG